MSFLGTTIVTPSSSSPGKAIFELVALPENFQVVGIPFQQLFFRSCEIKVLFLEPEEVVAASVINPLLQSFQAVNSLQAPGIKIK